MQQFTEAAKFLDEAIQITQNIDVEDEKVQAIDTIAQAIVYLGGQAVVKRMADGALIWQAPGYVLDAKYYKPRASIRAPSSPVKRMIADLS